MPIHGKGSISDLFGTPIPATTEALTVTERDIKEQQRIARAIVWGDVSKRDAATRRKEIRRIVELYDYNVVFNAEMILGDVGERPSGMQTTWIKNAALVEKILLEFEREGIVEIDPGDHYVEVVDDDFNIMAFLQKMKHFRRVRP